MAGVTLDSERTITQYAQIFRIDLRTIVRCLDGEKASTKWKSMRDRKVTVRDMAAAFGMDPIWILKHLQGRDTIIDRDEAMRNAGVSRFHWWRRNYEAAARIPMDFVRVARYSNQKTGEWTVCWDRRN